MFLSSLKAYITHSKQSAFLAFLTIFLSVALVCAMLNLTLNIGDSIAKELNAYGANISVTPKSQNLAIEIGSEEFRPLAKSEFLEEKYLPKIKDIFWRNNITALAPFLSVKAGKYDILGTHFDKELQIEGEDGFKSGVKNLYPFWVVDGEWPKDDSLDSALASEDLGLKIGDIINLSGNGDSVKITGILHAGAKNKIITSLALAQKLSGKLGLIERAEVSAMTIPENDLSIKARRDLDSLDAVAYDKWYCSAYVGSIAYQISEEYPNASANAVLSVSETQSQITQKIQSLMAVATAISLVVSAISIASLLTSQVRRRSREIGLLKALGATNAQVYFKFISEIFIICLIAAIMGCAAGYLMSFALSYQIFGEISGASLVVAPISVIYGFIICLAGSIAPLKRLSDLNPAEVLYGRK